MKSLLLFLLCASPALARIGDTRAQCEVRYGASVHSDEESTHYEKAGYRVICTFYQGKCDSVVMSHPEDAAGRTPPMTESERTMLLRSISSGMTWTKVWEDKDTGAMDWECPTMEATYSGRPNHMLLAGSREFFKRRQKASAADEPDPEREARERLEGF